MSDIIKVLSSKKEDSTVFMFSETEGIPFAYRQPKDTPIMRWGSNGYAIREYTKEQLAKLTNVTRYWLAKQVPQ